MSYSEEEGMFHHVNYEVNMFLATSNFLFENKRMANFIFNSVYEAFCVHVNNLCSYMLQDSTLSKSDKDRLKHFLNLMQGQIFTLTESGRTIEGKISRTDLDEITQLIKSLVSDYETSKGVKFITWPK